jgi:hypothetical protein
MPIAARDGVCRLDRGADPRGSPLRQGGRGVGHLPWHYQEVVALNHLDALARSPRRSPRCSRRRRRRRGGSGRCWPGGRREDALTDGRVVAAELDSAAAGGARAKVYSPRLRRDQIEAVYYLKRFEGGR